MAQLSGGWRVVVFNKIVTDEYILGFMLYQIKIVNRE